MSGPRAVLQVIRLLGCALSLALAGCMSSQQFDQLVAEASTCTAADTCTLAGKPDSSTTCTCPQPVRSTEAANVDAAARQVACGGKMVKCIGWVNPRCEAGRCVADR
jgi:hypothetical protein